ncbi:MAG TPA: polysaccharide deacetylase family protein [Acidimicrobiales bacterium]|nr:polysaccharide deacetylase family protein [Acidimicrobiales bacterium]
MQAGPTILLYHRVRDVADDPLLLSVSPAHFDEHLSVIREWGTPVRLGEIVAGLVERRRLPKRAVVVTIDDGYVDLATEVAPALERHGVPATAYVTAAAVERGEPFWWDRITDAVIAPVSLPAELDLAVAGVAHRWEVDDQESPRWEHRRPWLLAELQRVLRPVPPGERDAAVARVEAWADHRPDPAPRTTVTPDQLQALADGGLVEVGAHTVSHAQLSALGADAQEAEIAGGKSALESVLDRPVTTFAYPYGGREDYDAVSVATARRVGFTSACANVAGRVTRRSDRFELPRVHVPDGDGDTLARRLRALR